MTEDQRTARRQELMGLLGELPPRAGNIIAETIAVEERETYRLEKLLLHLNGIEPVPAYLTKPNRDKKVPAIIYNHAHGGNYQLGKDELLHGRGSLQAPPYAEALAQKGIAALAIDAWGFGERRGRTESAIFKEMLWNGQVMWGMMLFDSLKAFDYLTNRLDIDNKRIGTLGLSMGSTMAWWLAAAEPRIKLCIDLCCLTDFHTLIKNGGLDEHSVYYYVPSLLKHFTTAQINALIAPRPHLSLAGIYDPLTPLEGLQRIDLELKKTYQKENAPDAWRLLTYATGHFETAAMRKEVLSFLDKWL